MSDRPVRVMLISEPALTDYSIYRSVQAATRVTLTVPAGASNFVPSDPIENEPVIFAGNRRERRARAAQRRRGW